MESANQINTSYGNVASLGGAKGRVIQAIRSASEKSGVDFSYLLNKASQESSLNPSAKATGSSATGLYQFIEQTWLKTVKQSGAAYGLAEEAAKITVGSDGMARVASAADRKAILALRNDPEIASEMAAELAKANKEQLQAEVGGKIGSTELYMAHFLGASGAAEFLTALKTDPNAKAADLLPQAAAANKSVFYDSATGAAKSVKQIYAQFAKKFETTPDLSAIRVASAGDSSAEQAEKALGREIAQAAIAGGSSGRVGFTSGVSIDKTTSTPFAAMMLAQMDMEVFGLDALAETDRLSYRDEGDRRKSVLNTLASVG